MTRRDASAVLAQALHRYGLIIPTPASLVGFGAGITSLPGFSHLRLVPGVAPENPLPPLAIAVNLLAGTTGTASGGMSIALPTLGDT